MDPDITQKLLDLRIESLKMVLESFRKDYAVHEDIFSKLDQKAQSIVGLAGAFLAAALAFVKFEELGKLFATVGVFGLLILSASIFILIYVVAASVWATGIRACPLPPKPTTLLTAAEDILRLESTALSLDHFENNIRHEIGFWKTVNEGIANINQDKSKTIVNAQISLSIAIILIAILLFVVILAIFIKPN